MSRDIPETGPLLAVTPFLQVCLHSASDLPRDAAREMAAGLLRQLADGADIPDAMRGQVALFTDACTRLGVLRQSPAYKKLTALSLREARRNALMLQDRARLLAFFTDLGIAATEIRGPMLGQRHYPAPDLRHTHALKFAPLAPFTLRDQQFLVARLNAAGWRPSQATRSHPGYRTVLTSPVGVEAELYQRLLPHADPVLDPGVIANVEFQIAMVLCQSLFEPQRQSMRWVCDLAFLCAAVPIDVEKVVALVEAFGLAGSCHRSLLEVLSLLPGSDAAAPRKVTISLLRGLQALQLGAPRNTRTADAALRAFAPARRGRVRRAVSALRRAVLSRRGV